MGQLDCGAVGWDSWSVEVWGWDSWTWKIWAGWDS